MEMHDPAHPGEILRELCLEPLGLSVTETAVALGVTRKALSELLNGRTGVSPEMALRLAKAFGTEPTFWLGLQLQYELWTTRQKVGELQVRELSKPYQAR